MKHNLTINLVPYRIISDSVDLFFSANEKRGQKIKKDWVPSEFVANVPFDKDNKTYWSFESSDDSVEVKFEFFKNDNDNNQRFFLKRVFTQLLQKHFQDQGLIVGTSYIGDSRVWISTNNKHLHTRGYEVYDKYSVRVDIDAFNKNSGVFISYDGQSTVSQSTIKDLVITDIGKIGKVVLGNQIFSRNYEDFPKDLNDCRVIFNRQLEGMLGVTTERKRSQNKYRDYFDKVDNFYRQYLSGKSIINCFEILSGGFSPIPEDAISTVNDDSNLLEFKNHVRNVNVYDGLKRAGGPYSGSPLNDLQFLFIFMESDRVSANKMFSFLNKGFKNFPGLEKYVSVPFNVDFTKSLRVKDENSIITEVTEWLNTANFETGKKYFVIYISPIDKNDEDEDRNDVYYKIKELLLQKEISSQVVFKKNLSNDSFNFYLPNIAVAILAKVGGIPWRLPYPLKKDLVIGIGAHRNADTNSVLIGNAICFRNDGQFREFKVFPADNIEQLSESFKNSIKGFIDTSGECNRLIIHYFKALGWKERSSLDKAMKQLNVDIPYFFVTVNDTESKDYVVFDNDFEGKMPISGTIIRLRFNEFLLCNNTRYESNTGQKLLGYPFPIKVKINSQPKEYSNDFIAVKEILNQVYEFSRIYWKSIRQRNKPVTIEYSEIIARVVSQFNDKKLPDSDTARKSLWFL